MELEKKKNKVSKQTYKGPVIRYHSVTMPLIEELPAEDEINVDEDADGWWVAANISVKPV